MKVAAMSEDNAVRGAQLLLLTEDGLDLTLRLHGGVEAVRMREWLDSVILPFAYASPHFPLVSRSPATISAATVVRRIAELLQELEPGEADVSLLQLLQAELLGGAPLPERRDMVRARLAEARSTEG